MRSAKLGNHLKRPVNDLVLEILPAPLVKFGSNTMLSSRLGGKTLNGGEGEGECYISQIFD